MADRTTSSLSALGPRILSAIVLAPVALGVVWWGGWPYNVLVALAGAILVTEWARMVGRSPGWLAFGAIYVALACWALWWLRQDPDWGLVTVLWLLAVVWGADIGGYAYGMTIGGPKLCPRISPGKTWAGFAGGTFTAALAGWAVAALAFDGGGSVKIALFGALVAVASQAGDLFESWIKRRFGVKDSGTLIPGHGGLFDRVDGLVAAALTAALINLGPKGNVLAWL